MTNPTPTKKLIEVALPLEAINAAAARLLARLGPRPRSPATSPPASTPFLSAKAAPRRLAPTTPSSSSGPASPASPPTCRQPPRRRNG